MASIPIPFFVLWVTVILGAMPCALAIAEPDRPDTSEISSLMRSMWGMPSGTGTLDSAQAAKGIARTFRPDRVRVRIDSILTESRSWRVRPRGLFCGSVHQGSFDAVVMGDFHYWQDIDTLWARENLARGGAMTIGAILGTVGGLMGMGVGAALNGSGHDGPGPFVLGSSGFALGGVAGLALGAVVGSLGHRWVRVYPGTTPEPAADRRSRRRR